MFFLIADDSPEKRALLYALVKHSPWKGDILQAADTGSAIQMIEQHPNIAGAFIDYNMPKDNGPAVIRALRKANPIAHIALVTAADSALYRSEAIAAGADNIVSMTSTSVDAHAMLQGLLRDWML